MVERASFRLRFSGGASLELGPVTRVMGILNITPDSFSDGGRFADPSAAADVGARMAESGADLIDVGGESTRPGSAPVGDSEEADRVLPVIENLRNRTSARISIDTTKAGVARQALDTGADLVNDVSAFGDPDMLSLVRKRSVPVIVMHMRGSPRTMQQHTHYDDVVTSVTEFLRNVVDNAVAAGIPDDKIVVDPGIGFGKSTSGNLALLRELVALKQIGRPILVGASRKSFIGKVLDLPVTDRLEGSLAVAAFAATQGAHIVRVHDVAATVRAVRMIDAIRGDGRRGLCC